MAKTEVQTFEKKEIVQDRDLGVESALVRAEIKEKAKYALARQFPRNEEVSKKRILEAVKLPEFAESCYYSYPRANREIYGGSIKLATEMARIFGNIDIDRIIVNAESEGDTRTLKVYVTDLETNFHSSGEATFKKLIQRKIGIRTEWIQPDERDLRELTNRHFALLTRNCIFDIIPRWFTNMVVEKARETVKKYVKKADIKVLREKVLREFGSMGIYQDYFGAGAIKPKPEEKKEGDITLDQVLDGEVKHEGSKEGPPPSTPPPIQETSKPSEKELTGDERLLEEFKKALLKCNTAVEVQKYMKEVRASQAAMRISQAVLGQMANLANDRMRELLKKEGA
jgi:hypothetical protein